MTLRLSYLLLLLLITIPVEVGATSTKSIVLFGDSIVAGAGLVEKEALPAQLQDIMQGDWPEITIINAGVSGDTTAGGRGRLEWTLNRHNPDLVFLALGGNDLLRGVPVDVTRENLDAMLTLLKERNIPVILSRVDAPDNYGPAYQEDFDAIYRDLAEKYAVPSYPFLLEKTYGNTDLMQKDGIHPNARGVTHIAENLAEFLGDYIRKEWAPPLK